MRGWNKTVVMCTIDNISAFGINSLFDTCSRKIGLVHSIAWIFLFQKMSSLTRPTSSFCRAITVSIALTFNTENTSSTLLSSPYGPNHLGPPQTNAFRGFFWPFRFASFLHKRSWADATRVEELSRETRPSLSLGLHPGQFRVSKKSYQLVFFA